MAWNNKLVIILVAISALIPPPTAVGDILSPLSPHFSPALNGICDLVECGKGKCVASSNHTFGFDCECNPGWTKFHTGDHFRFLPCIIPNCSIDYSCTKNSVAPSPAPAPVPAPPTNLSIFDPCMFAYCGGGKCSATSTYEHKCECNEGYNNLFNSSAFACYADCSLGADCANLGINLTNSTSASSSPPNPPHNSSSFGGDGICDIVECGKGKCVASSNDAFGFACECNPGWTKFHTGDHFRFLPCIIPNCSIDYSCTKNSLAPAPAPLPAPPTNLSIFDPCTFAYCGGGKCSATSTFEHKCECNEGYINLFNSSAFACYADCSLGADCANLGINLTNSTSASSSPSNLADSGSSFGGDPFAPTNSIWLFFSVISLALVG